MYHDVLALWGVTYGAQIGNGDSHADAHHRSHPCEVSGTQFRSMLHMNISTYSGN